MKKIIPFKKDIIFKTNISEITSISLEHSLSITNNVVNGDFIVSGEYRITDESIHAEPFSYSLPFDIHMDDKYLLEHANIDIDDFYYEIVNSNVLSVNIDVLIDKLEERLMPEIETLEEVNIPKENILKEERVFTLDEVEKIIEDAKEEFREEKLENTGEEVRCVETEDELPIKRESVTEEITSLFDNLEIAGETYRSYKIYIIREGDDLEYIMEKYETTKEEIEPYNDLTEIKVGDKIVIPCMNETA